MLLAMILAGYVLYKNPFNVRGLLLYKLGLKEIEIQVSPSTVPGTTQPTTAPAGGTADTALPINDAQKDALDNLGIDAEALPPITPEMEACFREKLGDQRVGEIMAGDTPGVMDMFKAGSCL